MTRTHTHLDTLNMRVRVFRGTSCWVTSALGVEGKAAEYNRTFPVTIFVWTRGLGT